MIDKIIEESKGIPDENKRTFVEEQLKEKMLIELCLFVVFSNNKEELKNSIVFSRDSALKEYVLNYIIERELIGGKELIEGFIGNYDEFELKLAVKLYKLGLTKLQDYDTYFFEIQSSKSAFKFFKELSSIDKFTLSMYWDDKELKLMNNFNIEKILESMIHTTLWLELENFISYNIPILYQKQRVNVEIYINEDGNLSVNVLEPVVEISERHINLFYNEFAQKRIRLIKEKIVYSIDNLESGANFESLLILIRKLHEFVGISDGKENFNIAEINGGLFKILRNDSGHAYLSGDNEKEFLLSFIKVKGYLDIVSDELFDSMQQTLKYFDIDKQINKEKIKNLLSKNLEFILYETNHLPYIFEIVELSGIVEPIYQSVPGMGALRDNFFEIWDKYLVSADKIQNDKGLENKGREKKLKKINDNYGIKCCVTLDFSANVLKFQIIGSTVSIFGFLGNPIKQIPFP